MARGIEPGDLVTTGTITRAFPVRAGETWTTEARFRSCLLNRAGFGAT
jgi:2-keto-4-pentenoate hydratase